jgi:uncharacterized protein YoxC
MIVEIALCVGAVALVVLVGALVPLLIQLRKPVAESEFLLVHLNAELPLLLKEIRVTTENLNALVEHARDGVEHAAVLLHAAGALGDTVQRVHDTVQGTSRSLLVNLASMVAGLRATTAVITARIHREGGTCNGRGQRVFTGNGGIGVSERRVGGGRGGAIAGAAVGA